MRALRIRDENAVPQLPAGKTLHSRNKSTPALSTLMQVGGIKAAAVKRTVFGDVSNTTRQPTAKDDLQITGKKKTLEILKDAAPAAVKDTTKVGALSRPAQRPAAGISSMEHASKSTKEVACAATKQVSIDTTTTTTTTTTTNARKTLSKKSSTAVFQEAPLSAAIDEPIASVPQHQPLPAQSSSFPNVDRATTMPEHPATIPEEGSTLR